MPTLLDQAKKQRGEVAKEQQQPKLEIKNKNGVISTKETVKGEVYEALYDDYSICHSCHKERWVASQTGGCLICDKVMSEKQYQDYLKILVKTKPTVKENKMFDFEETTEKKAKPKEETIKAEVIEKKEDSKTEEFAIIPQIQEQAITRPLSLTERKQQILDTIELYKFTIGSVLDKDNDYHQYKGQNQKQLKRSGCIKLALVFNISVETLDIKVEEGLDENGNKDVIAYAKVKATRPNGSYVIISASKSKSEYWSSTYKTYGSYNLHNLKATAETRASNRAIINAIGYTGLGFSAVSYEEMPKQKDDNDMFAF